MQDSDRVKVLRGDGSVGQRYKSDSGLPSFVLLCIGIAVDRVDIFQERAP